MLRASFEERISKGSDQYEELKPVKKTNPLNDEAMWKAVVNRDESCDGQFVYAVKTTGVYCRPSCPAKRPNRDNAIFYDTTNGARQAGFRACARCRPDEDLSKAEAVVAQVRRYIEEHLDEKLTLEKLAGVVELSPYYLQRLFKSRCELTPRQYADECRLSALKKRLSAGTQVTEAMYDAGYGSSSRLYERSAQQLGMTPGSYKKKGAGEQINFAFLGSDLGLIVLAATEKGLCFLQFGDSEEELIEALTREFSNATISKDTKALSAWLDALRHYLSKSTTSNDETIEAIDVDLNGTLFQQAVWRYLRQIAPGQTKTYSEVAEAIGYPKAVRAVANACASNRIAIAVPCHRVVRNDGSLGGYRWGLQRKQELLNREKQKYQRT